MLEFSLGWGDTRNSTVAITVSLRMGKLMATLDSQELLTFTDSIHSHYSRLPPPSIAYAAAVRK